MSSKQAFALEENKRIARRFPEEVATGGDLDLIDEICTEDVIDHTPLWDVEGRDAVKDQAGAFFEAFGDFSATVEDIIAEGDLVAMRVTLRGTHEGDFMGLEPTDRSFEVDNMVLTRMEEGRIAERWVQPDTLGLLRQLGAETIPTAPAE